VRAVLDRALGVDFEHACAERGLSMRDVAAACGVGETTPHAWRVGRCWPSLASVLRLRELLAEGACPSR
jgi:hypothetical protein